MAKKENSEIRRRLSSVLDLSRNNSKEIMLLERNYGKFLNKYIESFKKAGRLQVYNKSHSLL
jgi:hypothetical protein